MKKKILITAGIVIVIASILANGYFIGWKRMQVKFYSAGANDAINSVVQQAQNTGEVRINTEKGTLILVPTTQQTINEVQE